MTKSPDTHEDPQDYNFSFLPMKNTCFQDTHSGARNLFLLTKNRRKLSSSTFSILSSSYMWKATGLARQKSAFSGHSQFGLEPWQISIHKQQRNRYCFPMQDSNMTRDGNVWAMVPSFGSPDVLGLKLWLPGFLEIEDPRYGNTELGLQCMLVVMVTIHSYLAPEQIYRLQVWPLWRKNTRLDKALV